MNASAWKLYHSCFKDGEEVVVIDEDDVFHWGKLETHDEYCILRRSFLNNDKVMWENVVFMSHDGFPVKRLQESSRAAAALEKLRTSGPATTRRLLTATICDRCEKVVDKAQASYSMFGRRYKDSATGKRIPTFDGLEQENILCPECRALCEPVIIRRGDSWEIECATARLYNPGNFGPDHWGEDDEEMIVATSGDGAIAHISAVDTIFDLEVV